MTKRRDPPKRGTTRDRILRTGVRLFQAHGYHGASVAMILEGARIPKGSFYHHFPDGKEQLAVEAVAWLAHEVDRYLDELAEAGANGADMAVGLAEHAAKGLAKAHAMRGSLITVLAAEAVPGSASIADALARAVDGWAMRLAAAFARSKTADPQTAARAALALVEGATVLARISQRPNQAPALVARLLKKPAQRR